MAFTASLYSQVSSGQAEDGRKLIDRLSSLKDSHVLDLGCGTGYLSSVLAELVGPGGKVTGVDPDRERIRLAREQFGSISNLEFVEGHSEDFPSGPYDVIFSNHVLHWIQDKEPVFQNIFQNLRVGGKFAFLCGGSIGSLATKIEALMEPGEPKIKDSIHFCPPDTYEAIANRCGFQMDFKSLGSRKYNFPNIRACSEWIYASTSGQVDYTSIKSTLLDEAFGDEPVTYAIDTVTYIFLKV